MPNLRTFYKKAPLFNKRGPRSGGGEEVPLKEDLFPPRVRSLFEKEEKEALPRMKSLAWT